MFSQHFSFKNLTVEHGLGSNTLYRVLQDSLGYIWTCGETGISKFDSKKITSFTAKEGLLDNEIIKICEDSRGRIWYVSLKGKVGIIKEDTVLDVSELNNKIDDIIIDINCFANNKVLLIGQKKCFWLINDMVVESHNLTYDIAQNPAFYINKFSRDNDLRILPGSTLRTKYIYYSLLNHKKIKVLNDSISLKPDVQNLHNKRYFPSNSKIYSIDHDLKINLEIEDSILNEANILSFLAVSDNEFWIGTYSGLFYLVRNGNQYTLKSTLEGKKISCIIKDRESNIFITTLGSGLFQLPSTKILTFSTQEGLSSQHINSAANNFNRTILIGCETGQIFSLSNNKSINRIPTTYTSSYERVTGMNQSNTKTFVITDRKIISIDSSENASTIFDPPEGLTAKNISVGKEFCWVGTFSFLNKFDPKKLVNQHITTGRTTAVLEDSKDGVWFSNHTGLHYLVGKKIRNMNFLGESFKERMSCIKEDHNGIIWFATQGKGLLYYNPQTKATGSFTKETGLADDICNFILIDTNKLWIGTNEGITKISFRKSMDNYYIQNIGIKQGLASNSVKSITKMGDFVYAATSNGLSFFRESEVLPNLVPPPIYITGLRLWEKEVTLKSEFYFDHTDNNIKIDFVGLAYKTMGNTQYKYKMVGVDTAWISTYYNTASYPSLPPGTYYFYVKAINEDGVESSNPAMVFIDIREPLWQKWWFWSTLIGAMIFGGIWISIHEVKTTKIQANMQTKINESEQMALQAQMNPHFVFNALNSIQKYVAGSEAKVAHGYLSKFGKLIRSIFENSMYKTISIQEEVNTLKIYLELETLRFERGFDFRVLVSGSVDQYQLEIPSMIIQPYIENAIWHGLMHKGSRGHILVKINRVDGGICCIVQDNGVGRAASQALKDSSIQHKSSAMRITAERLRLLSLDNEFESKSEIIDLVDDAGNAKGTRVIIYLLTNF